MNKSRRNFYFIISLAGVLSGTCVLLLALAPLATPLQPNASAALAYIEDPQKIFQTQTRIEPARWAYIYVHHSRSISGNAMTLSQGLQGLGDHFVICNGDGCGDGEIQIGQRWNQQSPAAAPEGASAIDSRCISICLVGDFDQGKPTSLQMKRLSQLVSALQARFRLPPAAVMTIEQPQTQAGIGRYFPTAAFRTELLP